MAGSVRTKKSAAVPFRKSDLNGYTQPLEMQLKWLLLYYQHAVMTMMLIFPSIAKWHKPLSNWNHTATQSTKSALPYRFAEATWMATLGLYRFLVVTFVLQFCQRPWKMWQGRKWRTCCCTVSQKRLKWPNVAFLTVRRWKTCVSSYNDYVLTHDLRKD